MFLLRGTVAGKIMFALDALDALDAVPFLHTTFRGAYTKIMKQNGYSKTMLTIITLIVLNVAHSFSFSILALFSLSFIM